MNSLLFIYNYISFRDSLALHFKWVPIQDNQEAIYEFFF